MRRIILFSLVSLFSLWFVPFTVFSQGAANMRISPDTVGPLTVGTRSTLTFTVQGGTGPYTWVTATGTPPAGMSMQPQTGNKSTLVISGTPTTAQTYTLQFEVKGTAAAESTVLAFKTYRIEVRPSASGGDDESGGGGGQQNTDSGSTEVGSCSNPLSDQDIPSFLVRLIEVLLSVTGILAVLFIIIGGLRMITSAGDSTAVTAGKNTIKYALFGLILAVLSFAIVRVITNVLIK